MDLVNALWLGVTCAVVAYVSAVALRRREQAVSRDKCASSTACGGRSCRVSSRGSLRDIGPSRASNSGAADAHSPTLAAASLSPQAGLLTHGLVGSVDSASQICHPVHNRHSWESPSPSACGSAAGSVANSTASSRSKSSYSGSDSDGDTDIDVLGSRACTERSLGSDLVGVKLSSCLKSAFSAKHDTQHQPSRPVRQHSRPLRPALRQSTIISTTGLPSADCGSDPTANHGQLEEQQQPERQSKLRRSSKSVTFKAGGAIICCPPTADALGLLAAGAPPEPVRTRSGWSTGAAATIPCNTARTSWRRPSLSLSVPPAATMAAGSARALSSQSSSLSSSPSCLPSLSPSPSPSSSARTPSSRLVAVHPVSTWDDDEDERAHAAALARAASGRRRVMAALEEAKNRHAHLLGSPVVGGPGIGASAGAEAEAAATGGADNSNNSSCSGRRSSEPAGRFASALAVQQRGVPAAQQGAAWGAEAASRLLVSRRPLPMVPPEDASILRVAYADQPPPPSAPSPPPSAAASPSDAPAVATRGSCEQAAACPAGTGAIALTASCGQVPLAAPPRSCTGSIGGICRAGSLGLPPLSSPRELLGQLAGAADRIRLAEVLAKQAMPA